MSRIQNVNVPVYKQLVGGADPAPLEKNETILAGQGTLLRGSVLGIVTGNDKLKLADSASTDGSEKARFILSQDVDTDLGDAVAAVFMAGLFNRNHLVLGGTDTPQMQEENLRDFGIYLTTEH